MRKRDLQAELASDNDGNFIAQQVTFRVINHRDRNDYQEEQFKRVNARKFELSLTDNRIIKLKLYDSSARDYIEYSIVFSNVHKKHQFSELFNIEELTPNKLARIPSLLTEELRKAILEP